MILWFLLVVCLAQSQREEELGKEVENLDATEDGEAREESHSAADQTKSSNKGHLLSISARFQNFHLCILFNFVEGRAVEEDMHYLKVQGDLGSWEIYFKTSSP